MNGYEKNKWIDEYLSAHKGATDAQAIKALDTYIKEKSKNEVKIYTDPKGKNYKVVTPGQYREYIKSGGTSTNTMSSISDISNRLSKFADIPENIFGVPDDTPSVRAEKERLERTGVTKSKWKPKRPDAFGDWNDIIKAAKQGKGFGKKSGKK